LRTASWVAVDAASFADADDVFMMWMRAPGGISAAHVTAPSASIESGTRSR
jgi:hypothetical protein